MLVEGTTYDIKFLLELNEFPLAHVRIAETNEHVYNFSRIAARKYPATYHVEVLKCQEAIITIKSSKHSSKGSNAYAVSKIKPKWSGRG